MNPPVKTSPAPCWTHTALAWSPSSGGRASTTWRKTLSFWTPPAGHTATTTLLSQHSLTPVTGQLAPACAVSQPDPSSTLDGQSGNFMPSPCHANVSRAFQWAGRDSVHPSLRLPSLNSSCAPTPAIPLSCSSLVYILISNSWAFAVLQKTCFCLSLHTPLNILHSQVYLSFPKQKWISSMFTQRYGKSVPSKHCGNLALI